MLRFGRVFAALVLTTVWPVQTSQAVDYSGTTGWSTISKLNIYPSSILVYLDVLAPANGCASPVFRVSAAGSSDGFDFHRATLLGAKLSQTEISLRYDLDDTNDCKINIDSIYVR